MTVISYKVDRSRRSRLRSVAARREAKQCQARIYAAELVFVRLIFTPFHQSIVFQPPDSFNSILLLSHPTVYAEVEQVFDAMPFRKIGP